MSDNDHLNEFSKLSPETLAYWFGTAVFLAALSGVRSGIKDGLTFFMLNLFIYALARYSRMSNFGAIVVTILSWGVAYFFVRRVMNP